MPSTRKPALLVALLLVLSGCNAIPSGDSTTSPTATTHTVGYLSSSDSAYNATVTVADAEGSTLTERRLTFDGDRARYVELTTVNDTGNYTIHVQTDLPAVGGGEMASNHTITAEAGKHVSVVHTTFQGISVTTGAARDQRVDTDVTYMWAIPHPGRFTYELHRGDALVENESFTTGADVRAPETVGAIERSGVYWIAASTNHSHAKTYHVGVVNESTSEVRFMVSHEGEAKVQFLAGDDGGFASRPPMPPANTRTAERIANDIVSRGPVT